MKSGRHLPHGRCTLSNTVESSNDSRSGSLLFLNFWETNVFNSKKTTPKSGLGAQQKVVSKILILKQTNKNKNKINPEAYQSLTS